MVVGASIFADQGRAAERRRAQRAAVSLPVLIHSGGRQHVARLLDLSCSGAKVETAASLACGAQLVLSCGTIEADAAVVWGNLRTFGIRFLAPVRDTVVTQQICRSQAAAGRLPAPQ